MEIERFEDENQIQQYLDWRKRNPEGYVLNLNTRSPNTKSTKNVIHLAGGCRSLDTPPMANRNRPVSHIQPKLCSTDIRDLIIEMETHNLSYKICDHCLRELVKIKEI